MVSEAGGLGRDGVAYLSRIATALETLAKPAEKPDESVQSLHGHIDQLLRMQTQTGAFLMQFASDFKTVLDSGLNTMERATELRKLHATAQDAAEKLVPPTLPVTSYTFDGGTPLDLGPIGPLVFLPIAPETGLIDARPYGTPYTDLPQAPMAEPLDFDDDAPRGGVSESPEGLKGHPY